MWVKGSKIWDKMRLDESGRGHKIVYIAKIIMIQYKMIHKVTKWDDPRKDETDEMR